MMATLYKTDRLGRMRFYTIHDLQKPLLGGYAFTVTTGSGAVEGKEKLVCFDDRFAGVCWLSRTLAAKRAAGYLVLYSYGVPGLVSETERSTRKVV